VLYQGNGYLMAFCKRMHCCYNDAVSYAFLLAFTISPTITSDSALVSDDEDSDNGGDKPTKPVDLNSKIEFNFKNKKTQFLSSVSLSVCELVCVTESGKERKLDTDNLCMCVCV
jgi:hypothetical protein